MVLPRKSMPWLLAGVCAVLVLWSWWSEGLVRQLFTSGDPEFRVQQLKSYIESFGTVAPIVYVGFVVIEVVVAPIPGLMLYAPGGIIFGPFVGGALSLLGNVIGAGVACGVTRAIGDSWLSRFFERERFESMQSRLAKRGAWWIFLLRVNPLTSSDMVSYAAGFSRIPFQQVLFATACGMAPLCFLQAWLAERVLSSFPSLLYPLVLLMVVYFVCVVLAIRRLMASPPAVE